MYFNVPCVVYCNSYVCAERESTMCLGNSDEEMQATQLYTAGTDEKEGETMEFEKTVAYNLGKG